MRRSSVDEGSYGGQCGRRLVWGAVWMKAARMGGSVDEGSYGGQCG